MTRKAPATTYTALCACCGAEERGVPLGTLPAGWFDLRRADGMRWVLCGLGCVGEFAAVR